MPIYISIILFAGVLLIWWGIFGKIISNDSRVRLAEVAPEMKKTQMNSFLINAFPFTRNMLERFGWSAELKRKLDFVYVRLQPAAYFNLKLLSMVIFGAGAPLLFGQRQPWIFAICAAVGYIIPDIWLKRKIAERKHTISRLLPETVDLLGLCVEAGLDFITAIKWLLEKTPRNPMVEELGFVLEEIKWGKQRVQALKDMAKRVSVMEVTSFVHILVLSERMGTPVAETFTILSEDTRLQRFHQGERFAMKAPIKILIPLIFCILPVIFIIVAGPIILQFVKTGVFGSLGQ